MRFLNLLIGLSVLVNACIGQEHKNTALTGASRNKNNDSVNMEKFDIERFNKNQSGDGYYSFKNSDGSLVTQTKWGNQFFEEIKPVKNPFYIKKSFSEKGLLTHYAEQFHGNGFVKGEEKNYTNGKLVNTINDDELFKDFPWEKVELLLQKNKANLLDSFTRVWRELDENKIPVWYLSWDAGKTDATGNKVLQNMDVDGRNGQVIKSYTSLVGERPR